MCDALPRDMEFNISFSKTISFSRCVFQHPRHCEERQRRSNPEFEKRLGCFVDVRNNKAFSRRAFAPESCQTAVVNRRHRFRSVLHAKAQQANAGGSIRKRRFGHG